MQPAIIICDLVQVFSKTPALVFSSIGKDTAQSDMNKQLSATSQLGPWQTLLVSSPVKSVKVILNNNCKASGSSLLLVTSSQQKGWTCSRQKCVCTAHTTLPHSSCLQQHSLFSLAHVSFMHIVQVICPVTHPTERDVCKHRVHSLPGDLLLWLAGTSSSACHCSLHCCCCCHHYHCRLHQSQSQPRLSI